MPVSVSAAEARALCTKSELELVRASYAAQIKELTAARLRSKISRARKLRDKFRDLAKQQRGEARGKRKPTSTRSSQSNENTVRKATLFAETLERFETQLAKLEKDGSKKKTTSKKKTATGKKKAAVKKTGATAKKSSTAATAKKKKSATTRKSKSAPAKSASSVKKTKAGTAKSSSAPGGPESKAKGGSAVKSQKKTTEKAKATQGSAQSRKSSTTPMTGPLRSRIVSTAIPASIPARIDPSSLSLEVSGGTSVSSQLESRKTRRQSKSKKSRFGRKQSQFASTVADKIQGHISGSNRRSQARRDSK